MARYVYDKNGRIVATVRDEEERGAYAWGQVLVGGLLIFMLLPSLLLGVGAYFLIAAFDVHPYFRFMGAGLVAILVGMLWLRAEWFRTVFSLAAVSMTVATTTFLFRTDMSDRTWLLGVAIPISSLAVWLSLSVLNILNRDLRGAQAAGGVRRSHWLRAIVIGSVSCLSGERLAMELGFAKLDSAEPAVVVDTASTTSPAAPSRAYAMPDVGDSLRTAASKADSVERFRVQFGRFVVEEDAFQLLVSLGVGNAELRVAVDSSDGDIFYVVEAGPFVGREAADEFGRRIGSEYRLLNR